MSLDLTFVIVFAALLAVLVAVSLVLRDFFSEPKEKAVTTAGLRLDADVAGPANSLAPRLNQAFERFVQESATGIGPLECPLIMLITGGLAGCVLILWRNEPFVVLGSIVWGMMIPLTYLAFRRRRQLKELQNQIPEVLSLLARAVHAGESLDQAIELAGTESAAPLGEEFRLCSKQLKLGVPVSRVMQMLGRRIRVPDVRILASVLALHRNSGGKLASTLDHLAQVSRSRNSYHKQMRAATGAGRISAQFISACGPFLFLYFYFFQPDHIEPLLNSSMGMSLLIGAVVLYVFGVAWIGQMLRNQER